MKSYITPQDINLPEYEGFLQEEPNQEESKPDS